MDISIVTFICLILFSVVAGVLNAITGGGGMVLIPLMLVSGIPPINAIAINKFQNTIGSFSATIRYVKSGLLDLKTHKALLAYALFGSLFGVWLLQWFSQKGMLDEIIPYILILVAIYMFFSPSSKDQKSEAKISPNTFNSVVGTGSGFYGGFLGLGTGPFLIAAFSALRGDSLKEAVTGSKPVMLVINLSSLFVLMLAGHVWWLVGLLMAVGNVLGVYIGTAIVAHNYIRFIRVLIIAVPLISATKLLLSN